MREEGRVTNQLVNNTQQMCVVEIGIWVQDRIERNAARESNREEYDLLKLGYGEKCFKERLDHRWFI